MASTTAIAHDPADLWPLTLIPMAVTHCICKRKSLADILHWAREHNADSLPPIAQALGCSTYCGMCAPFIEYALATGETAVPFPCPPIPAKSLPGVSR